MSLPIEVVDLSFRYNQRSPWLLRNVHLSIGEGESLAIVGLSGAGKSTLCYCISGIIPHVYDGEMSGSVFLYGENTQRITLPKIATTLGVVFQNPDNQLFSPTVEDEVAFGPENLCLTSEMIGKRVDEALQLTGISHLRYDSPHRLSGGQKQLVALASVLSLSPRIIIFDEAMSQLDDFGRDAVKGLIYKLKHDGKTILMVEHDFSNLDVADRTLMLQDGSLTDFSGSLRTGSEVIL